MQKKTVVLRLLEKDSDINITKGLTAKEFQCKCSYESCTNILISESLIRSYRKFRTMLSVPLVITSGHRCHAHNKDVGGVKLSRHTSGQAIDIDLENLSHLDHEEIHHAAAMSGFTYIKIYKEKNFVHLDVR